MDTYPLGMVGVAEIQYFMSSRVQSEDARWERSRPLDHLQELVQDIVPQCPVESKRGIQKKVLRGIARGDLSIPQIRIWLMHGFFLYSHMLTRLS